MRFTIPRAFTALRLFKNNLIREVLFCWCFHHECAIGPKPDRTGPDRAGPDRLASGPSVYTYNLFCYGKGHEANTMSLHEIHENSLPLAPQKMVPECKYIGHIDHKLRQFE